MEVITSSKQAATMRYLGPDKTSGNERVSENVTSVRYGFTADSLHSTGPAMPQEIERKFLLADDTWRKEISYSTELRDGVLAFYDGRKIRIRFYDEKATLTVKGPRCGLTRDEFEYEIPASDGLILLERHCKGEVLHKTRHHVPCEGRLWSVDEYQGLLAGLIIAEVELPAEDTPLIIPAWAGKEVTGLEKYRKVNLVKARKKKLADAARRQRKRNGFDQVR